MIHDRTVIVKRQAIFFLTMIVIVTFNVPIFWAIWHNITLYGAILGQYRAIAGNIGRYRKILW